MANLPETDDEAMQPTPERIAKGGVVTDRALDKNDRTPRGARATITDLLDVYASRKCIDVEQLGAGKMFQATWVAAGLEPRCTVNLEAAGGVVGRSEMSDRVIAARQNLTRTRSALGSELYSCLESVCGHGIWADEWMRQRSKPPRHGVAILQVALNLLVEHYRGR